MTGCVQLSPDKAADSEQQSQARGSGQGPSGDQGQGQPTGGAGEQQSEESEAYGGSGESASSGEESGGSEASGNVEEGAADSAARTPCTASLLTGDLERATDSEGFPEEGSDGEQYGTITLTNEGDMPCSMNGYPELQMVGDKGEPEIEQLSSLDPKPSQVTLGSGESAWIDVTWDSVSAAGPCMRLKAFDVTLPNAPEDPEEVSDLQPVNAPLSNGDAFPCGGVVETSSVYRAS